VPQGGLGSFDQGLTDVADAESGLVRRNNVVVDHRSEVDCDVVFGHADLLGDFAELDFDVDLDEALGEGIDFDKTWVHGAVEAAEFGDETDVALGDGFVGIRAVD
jgi:hypothetical protein